MTYRAIVKNGMLRLLDGAQLPDGAEVRVTLEHRESTLGDLLRLPVCWSGDDTEDVVDLIYRTRTSRSEPAGK